MSTWDEAKKQRVVDIVQKAVPEAEITWWADGVLSLTHPKGCVSLLLDQREWAPGLTVEKYHLDKFAGEPVRQTSRFTGQGWQARLAKTAWTALTKDLT